MKDDEVLRQEYARSETLKVDLRASRGLLNGTRHWGTREPCCCYWSRPFPRRAGSILNPKGCFPGSSSFLFLPFVVELLSLKTSCDVAAPALFTAVSWQIW